MTSVELPEAIQVRGDGHKLWHPEIPALQLAWDSVSLRDFDTCPRLYQLHMVEGWVPKRKPVTLHFGICYHKMLETYEREKIRGRDFNTSLRSALAAAWKEWGDYVSDDNRRTKFTLTRAGIWYADKYLVDPAETLVLPSGEAAVELSFRIMLPWDHPGGDPYLICGHLDRIAKLGDDIRVVDAKTTASTISDHYLSMYDLDVQMDLYDFFGRIALSDEISGIMLDVCQTAVTFSRFQRAFSDRKPGQREEWFKELHYWIIAAEMCALEGYWPQNKTSCSKFGGCRYREVCRRDPSVRELVLKSDFKVEHWNPLENRGE